MKTQVNVVVNRYFANWIDFVSSEKIDIAYSCHIRSHQWVLCFWDEDNKCYCTGIFNASYYLVESIKNFEKDLDRAKVDFKERLNSFI